MILAAITFLLFILSTSLGSSEDGTALKRLMDFLHVHKDVLVHNWTGADPCMQRWQGVECTGPHVTSLVLNSMQLGRSLPDNAFSQLPHLRILSLSGNQLTGTLPLDLPRCTQLKSLYLQNNTLHGGIPSPLSQRLKRLYLSNNMLNGTIPSSPTDLPRLLTLHLEDNQLTGMIPDFIQPSLSDFNISNNKLEGPIPVTLVMKKLGAASFEGNALLCGHPLPPCAANTNSSNSGPTPPPKNGVMERKEKKKRLATTAIVAIVIGDMCLLLLITFLFLYYHRMRYGQKSGTQQSGSKVVPANGSTNGMVEESNTISQETQRPSLVFLEGRQTFQLDDLLRSSAELLGKGSLGPVYKACMDNGSVFAVKRLKDINCADQKKFVQEMELIGTIRHPNVVPLWAYYYSKQEKLIVYEYQQNGSVFTLLHGNSRSPNPLSWKARLRIARGVARGLAHIHHEFGSQRLPHGNIKASNVLIDKNYEACIADLGLATLVNSSHIGNNPAGGHGYRAPEYEHTRKVSKKADVYSFGVLLLEMLTGKMAENQGVDGSTFSLPHWVNSVVRQEWTTEVFDHKLACSKVTEAALVNMLQIALSCVSKSADQRPKMSHVANMIEDVKDLDDESAASEADRSLTGSETPDSTNFSFH